MVATASINFGTAKTIEIIKQILLNVKIYWKIWNQIENIEYTSDKSASLLLLLLQNTHLNCISNGQHEKHHKVNDKCNAIDCGGQQDPILLDWSSFEGWSTTVNDVIVVVGRVMFVEGRLIVFAELLGSWRDLNSLYMREIQIYLYTY